MAQADTGYVRAVGAGAWTEVVYAGNAGTFINDLVAALPAQGGEIIIGPASAQYRFTGTVASISKPCLILCAPGANFEPPAAAGGAVTGCLRFTSGGAGSKWIGGQFNDISGYAIDGARILVDVQNGAHDVHLEDIEFNLVNTVASGRSNAMVRVAGSSSASIVSGFTMDRCRFRCNSTREATSYTGSSILGWTCVRLQYAMHAKVRGCTFFGGATPQTTSTGNIRCILSMTDTQFCHVTGNSGYGLLGLSDEQVSGSDVIDAGASGLIECSNVDMEGHHSAIEGNNFEVATVYSLIRQLGSSYGTIKGNQFGRVQATDAVVRLADSGLGLGDATVIAGNAWHNISGPSQIKNAGYCLRVSHSKNVLIDCSQFTLVNKQNSYERYPVRIDNTAKDVVFGSHQMGFNMTATNQFAPFSPIVWEGRAAYEQTRCLFPSFFPTAPFVRP